MISGYFTGDNKINNTNFIRSEIIDLYFYLILKKYTNEIKRCI